MTMRFSHSDFAFEVDDEWWTAAGMQNWKPSSSSYLFEVSAFPEVREVLIADIAPVRRTLSHGVFNHDAESGLSARDRVMRILKGFREDAALPPVVIEKADHGETHPYRLTQGAHRFYLSIAAGFTHIPAVVF